MDKIYGVEYQGVLENIAIILSDKENVVLKKYYDFNGNFKKSKEILVKNIKVAGRYVFDTQEYFHMLTQYCNYKIIK